MQRPGLTLHDRVHETGSTTDMQLVLHMWLAGVSRCSFSDNCFATEGLYKVNRQLLYHRLCGSCVGKNGSYAPIEAT